MKRILRRLALLTVVSVVVATPVAVAAPMWAKKAIAFPERCDPNDSQACKPVRILAPDGKSRVEVHYRKRFVSATDWVMQAYLRVMTQSGTRKALLPAGFQKIDLLWSPDSKAFFVDGGNGGAYWGFWVYVYLVGNPQLKPLDLTREISRDMVKTFPPCKAAEPNSDRCNWDAAICRKAADKYTMQNEYNMTGIDWVDPSTILIMAEIPCSSSQGGIMCQVMGYELQVPSGRIRKGINAQHLKLNWRKSMAWDFQIPDPPRYCTASYGRTSGP